MRPSSISLNCIKHREHQLFYYDKHLPCPYFFHFEFENQPFKGFTLSWQPLHKKFSKLLVKPPLLWSCAPIISLTFFLFFEQMQQPSLSQSPFLKTVTWSKQGSNYWPLALLLRCISIHHGGTCSRSLILIVKQLHWWYNNV